MRNQNYNKPHSVGYQEGHRMGTEPYNIVYGTVIDKRWDEINKNKTIKDINPLVDCNDYGFPDLDFPF